MNIFYAPPRQITEDILVLSEEEAHHAVRVLRYKIGDEIQVVDGVGFRYSGIIQSISKKRVEVRISDKVQVEDLKSSGSVILGLAIIKNRQRLEFAIEKAVELGASSIILFESRYTEKHNIRLERLHSIVMSAMKQSLHARLPDLAFEASLAGVLEKAPNHMIIMAHEKVGGPADKLPIKKNVNYLLLIGPEGGFSDEEVALAQQYNGKLISLGKFRLRAETAAITLLSQFI